MESEVDKEIARDKDGEVKAWILEQEVNLMVVFKNRFLALIDYCNKESNKTVNETWKQKVEVESRILCEQIEIDKMLGLIGEKTNTDECAKAFRWITRQVDNELINKVATDLLVATYPDYLRKEKGEYKPPSMEQIAQFLVSKGDLAVKVFFWEENKARKLFTDDERREIKNWIEKLSSK